MSRPRNIWWSYVKAMIRRYPVLKAELDAMKEPSVTAKYGSIGHGSGVSKPTEQTALRQLSPVKQKEYDAVSSAIEAMKMRPDGEFHLELIKSMYWSRTHYNLAGAAQKVHTTEVTAKRWHSEFVYLVAEYYGLKD